MYNFRIWSSNIGKQGALYSAEVKKNRNKDDVGIIYTFFQTQILSWIIRFNFILMLEHWANHFNLPYLNIVGTIYVYRILKNIIKLISIMVYKNIE